MKVIEICPEALLVEQIVNTKKLMIIINNNVISRFVSTLGRQITRKSLVFPSHIIFLVLFFSSLYAILTIFETLNFYQKNKRSDLASREITKTFTSTPTDNQ